MIEDPAELHSVNFNRNHANISSYSVSLWEASCILTSI